MPRSSHPTHHPLWRHALGQYRFATTRQLARLSADAYSSLRSSLRQSLRHLNTLRQHRLVTSLERRIGGWRGGSAVTVWALTSHGYRALSGSRRRHRPQSLSTGFLAHHLAITEVGTTAVETIRQMPGTSLELAHEPDCWRSYLGAGGQELRLRPDLAAIVHGQHYDDHYFIEVDRATENPGRVRATCQRYQAYYATGAEQRTTGVLPIVVWIVPHHHRQQQLERAISSDPGIQQALFRIITMNQTADLLRQGPGRFPQDPTTDSHE